MNARQDLAALPCEQGPDRCELLPAHDARAQRLALEPLHEEAVAEAVLGLEHVVHLRLGNAGVARAAHQVGFGAQPRAAGDGGRGLPAGAAAQRQLALAVRAGDHDAVGLLAGAAGQPLGGDQRAEPVDVAGQYL